MMSHSQKAVVKSRSYKCLSELDRDRGDFQRRRAPKTKCRRQVSATSTPSPPSVESNILDRIPFVKLLRGFEAFVTAPFLPFLSAPFLPSIFAPFLPSTAVNPKLQTHQEYDYIALKDLEFVGTLGAGGFGRVELVRYRKDKKLIFALKSLRKVEIVETEGEAQAYSEKYVMFQCSSCPFITKLFRTYRDSKYVYLLMEPCLGGNVFSVLRKNRSLDDDTARFMVSCVVEALEYLHERGFIFRDLKPENLVLDSQGYVKMIDFGLAKDLGVSDKAWTIVGTPEYMAPEIILKLGHDRAVDYWSLGILIHELLTGRTPFMRNSKMKTYKFILKGIDSVQFPRYVQRPASHLIRRLCRVVATDRIGCQETGGVKDIKLHRWFKGFNWIALQNRSMKAPIVVPIAGPTDVSNFDKCGKERKSLLDDELSGWDKDF